MRVLLQQLAERFAEDAHATAVDHTHARQPGQECAVDKPFDFAAGLIDSLSNDIDFAGGVRIIAFERNRNPSRTCRRHRRVGPRLRAHQHLGDVVACDPTAGVRWPILVSKQAIANGAWHLV